MLTKDLLIKQLRASNKKHEDKIKAIEMHLTTYPDSHGDWQEGRFKEWAEHLRKMLESDT